MKSPDACRLVEQGRDTEYYQIDLVSTKRVPGTGQARGIGAVSFAPTPFGISLTEDGSYKYNLDISIERLYPPREGVYVAWITTPEIDEIRQIGPLDENHRAEGTVEWNQFLVVITLEHGAPSAGNQWSGPVVLRGISRSGMMHTMAGHGPYESEPCAMYGY